MATFVITHAAVAGQTDFGFPADGTASSVTVAGGGAAFTTPLPGLLRLNVAAAGGNAVAITYDRTVPSGTLSDPTTLPKGVYTRGGTNQSLTAGAEAKVLLTTAEVNGGLTFDSVNNRVVCVSPGKYVVTGQVYLAGGLVAGDLVQAYLKKNGATTGMPFSSFGVASAFDVTVTFTRTITLAAGDYIEMFSNKATGSNSTINGLAGNTFLCVEYLGT